MGAGVMPSYWDCQSPPTWFTFGSGHPGHVNFAFCDGTVRSVLTIPASSADQTAAGVTPPALINTPRWVTFQQLAGIRDNATPNFDGIVE